MTLIELLVSLSILAVIGVGLTAAVDAGIRTLGAGGVPDHLRGSADAVGVERSVSADVARAGCVITSVTVLGSCPQPVTAFCGGVTLCLAWPDAAGGCDAARYRLAGTVLWRDSLTAGGATASSEIGPEVESLAATAHPAGGLADTVAVDLAAGSAAHPQRTGFVARPLVTDPRPC
jgi:hypothetical protein